MSFDWKLYIQLAEELIETTKEKDIEDAYLRASVGRAYYGVYGLACKRLENKGYSRKEFTHEKVRDCYINSDNNDLKKIGARLLDLFGYRIKADYHENAKINKNIAIMTCEYANEAADLLRLYTG